VRLERQFATGNKNPCRVCSTNRIKKQSNLFKDGFKKQHQEGSLKKLSEAKQKARSEASRQKLK